MARIERVELCMVDLPPRSSAPTPSRVSSARKRRSSPSPIPTARPAPATAIRSAPAAHRSCGCSPTTWPRASSAATPTRSRRSGMSLNSPPTRRRSARSPRSRSPRSTPRSGTCAPENKGLPLWKLAGGAKDRCPLYTTEGGWLHIETQALVDDALAAKAEGLSRLQGEDRPPARLRGCRAAVGGAQSGRRRLRDHDRLQPGFYRRRGDPPRRKAARRSISPGSRSRCRLTISMVMCGCHRRRRIPVAVGESLYSIRHFREYMQKRRLLHRPGRCRPDRRHHAMAQGRACSGGVRHSGLPAFPHGTACQPCLRHTERQIRRVYSSA